MHWQNINYKHRGIEEIKNIDKEILKFNVERMKKLII